ncbi:hypothetical protein ACF059_31770 [Streptomyces sp. NPDC016562]|uniref:hypothetical protein n=1 Tax=Streptomyces sp. NPDC016562 TaxID=3364966 RepID=UPI0036FA362F
MSYDLPTPADVQSKRRIARLGMALTSAVFISGAIALPATAATATSAPSTQPSVTGIRTHDHRDRESGGDVFRTCTCKHGSGSVWRDTWDRDTWDRDTWDRDTWKRDVLCVRPHQHDRVKHHDWPVDNGPHVRWMPER